MRRAVAVFTQRLKEKLGLETEIRLVTEVRLIEHRTEMQPYAAIVHGVAQGAAYSLGSYLLEKATMPRAQTPPGRTTV